MTKKIGNVLLQSLILHVKVDLDFKMYIINSGAMTNNILKAYIHKNSLMEVKWNHTKCPINSKAKILDTTKEKTNKLENRI